jgi:hypothetical protein
MRRLCFALFALFALPATVSATTFSFRLGGDFLNYTTNSSFLDMGFGWQNEIAKGMELDLGASFGIVTHSLTNQTVAPIFFIPVNGGLNFLFGDDPLTFLVGFGLTPVFTGEPGVDAANPGYFRIYIGPYLKAGIRVKVHELMRWYAEVEQDILVGGPTWINNCTRVTTGLNFNFGK